MVTSLTRVRVNFFDKTNCGAIVNLFSNDINVLDNNLPYLANDALHILSHFTNLMITCIIINPLIILPSILELILLSWFFKYSKEIIINTKNMDLENKAPIY